MTIEFFTAGFDNRKRADLLVLPYWKGKKQAEPAGSIGKVKAAIADPIETGDFTGKEGEVSIVYSSGQPEKRIALLGLGDPDKINVEKLRRAYASLAKTCRARKIKEINVVTPHITSLAEEGIIRGIAEGLLLANYTFDKLKRDAVKDDPTVLLTSVTLIGAEKAGLAIAKKYAAIASGVYLARDLVNGNADDITPQYLAHVAKDFAKKLPHIKTTVFDRKRIEKEKMGLLLAVNRASNIEPAFIIVEYKGNPKSKDLTAVVGKGITYDTGGLSLKPTASMATMKCDMGGAATVLGTIYAAASLGLKVNLTGVIASTENMIDAKSYKPGDVYTSYAGKTVEIMDTDAEGRLVLADALAYTAKHIKPTRIIDFATLTGACEIALGAETTGMLSNQDALADALIRSGYETYERLWRLPLFEEYRDQLKSDIADIKNHGGRGGGTITATMFMKEFVGDIPWAHCDIAATAFLSEPRRYHPKYGTGIGVRLMIDFLESL
jgi:leucyl aminopeptidase